MQNSIEFLGVKIVPMGHRPRRAVKVLRAGSTMALLPNGNVASVNRNLFRFHFDPMNRSDAPAIAEGLRNLGAITKETLEEFLKKHTAKMAKREHRDSAEELRHAAEKLGVKLTPEQRRAIKKALG